MSTSKTGNSTHDNKVNTAEAVRQSAVSAAPSPRSTVVTADAAFHRTAAKSAVANGCGSAPFMTALAELGQSLYP